MIQLPLKKLITPAVATQNPMSLTRHPRQEHNQHDIVSEGLEMKRSQQWSPRGESNP
jgi:hypothetical protein